MALSAEIGDATVRWRQWWKGQVRRSTMRWGKLDTPGEEAVRQERALLFAEALQELKPEYREVIVLRNLMGLTYPQVAERLGKSEGAARMLWTRALESLRNTFETT